VVDNFFMLREKPGDVVWYVVGDTTELAKLIAVRHSKTHATIRLLTGEQKGQEFEAPWGVIESERITTEPYREYFIEVAVRPLEDCTFTSGGFVRKPNPVGTGFPFETSFETTEKHPTEDAARRSGLAFAKKKIDG
jgi:hypothetical protein